MYEMELNERIVWMKHDIIAEKSPRLFFFVASSTSSIILLWLISNCRGRSRPLRVQIYNSHLDVCQWVLKCVNELNDFRAYETQKNPTFKVTIKYLTWTYNPLEFVNSSNYTN